MSEVITSAQYTAIAKELVASAANMLAAERRSYASIQADYDAGTGSDAYGHFNDMATALDAVATSLRS